jgi:hypothetical protein
LFHKTQEILSSIIAEYTSYKTHWRRLPTVSSSSILTILLRGRPSRLGTRLLGAAANISVIRLSVIFSFRTAYIFPVHDIHFEAQPRLFNLQVARHGRKSFAYAFPELVHSVVSQSIRFDGFVVYIVAHGAEMPYVYGFVQGGPSPGAH